MKNGNSDEDKEDLDEWEDEEGFGEWEQLKERDNEEEEEEWEETPDEELDKWERQQKVQERFEELGRELNKSRFIDIFELRGWGCVTALALFGVMTLVLSRIVRVPYWLAFFFSIVLTTVMMSGFLNVRKDIQNKMFSAARLWNHFWKALATAIIGFLVL